MAPLPAPKTPSEVYVHDIALSLRTLAGREDENDPETAELREPVQGVDATPTAATSKGTPAPKTEPKTEPKGDIEPVELDGMKRKELDAYAAEVGVEDPDKLPNMDAVRTAIREATS